MDALEVMAQQGKFKMLDKTFHSLVTKGYAAHIAQVSEGRTRHFTVWLLRDMPHTLHRSRKVGQDISQSGY